MGFWDGKSREEGEVEAAHEAGQKDGSEGESSSFWVYGRCMAREDIADAYAAADIAITRAGAMSIAELCAWGAPSVLVPLPSAAQDHQTFNARTLQSSGAAIHLPQSALTAESVDATVRELMARPDTLHAMRTAALLRARPGAADDIARAFADLLHSA